MCNQEVTKYMSTQPHVHAVIYCTHTINNSSSVQKHYKVTHGQVPEVKLSLCIIAIAVCAELAMRADNNGEIEM